MATYTIVPGSAGGNFAVSVIGRNGARQTLLGFVSEADAAAWIEQDKRLDDIGADPWKGNQGRLQRWR